MAASGLMRPLLGSIGGSRRVDFPLGHLRGSVGVAALPISVPGRLRSRPFLAAVSERSFADSRARNRAAMSLSCSGAVAG
jgi:hypothetical protein